MAEVINQVSPETVVKMAQLKEKLGAAFDEKRYYDPEGKRSLIKEYLKMFDGEIVRAQDIETFYNWKSGTAARFIAQLLEEGIFTFTMVKQGAGTGIKYRYHYHATPVSRDQRTIRGRSHVITKAPVQDERDKDIALRRLSSVREQAEAERQKQSEREQLVKRQHLAYIEQKAWEYLRDSADDIYTLKTLKAFVNYLRAEAGEKVHVQPGRAEAASGSDIFGARANMPDGEGNGGDQETETQTPNS